MVDTMTGKVVYEENPCKMIQCVVPVFGFWETRAVQIGVTPDNYAVCKCPHEPADQLYFVSMYRKY